MPPAMVGHEDCRVLVCGLCMNKAKRSVSTEEELMIRTLVPGYCSTSSYFPSGICVRCIFLLKEKRSGKEVQFLLPEDYHVNPPRNLRSRQGEKCVCNFCYLGRLAGPAFRLWQRKTKGLVKPKVVRLCPMCYIGILEGKTHTCSTSTLEAVENLSMSLSNEVKAKLAHSYLVSQATGSQPVPLVPAAGGCRLPVVLGKQPAAPPVQLTHQEVITIGYQNHLSSQQTENIFADLRTKYGRKFVSPGLATASSKHNCMYEEFFRAEEVTLLDSKGNEQMKTFFYCSSLIPFIHSVCDNRGIDFEDQKMKIGVDHGLEWEKITLTLSSSSHTFPVADPVPKKVQRRKYKDGVGRINKSDTGQETILFLGVVRSMKESHTALSNHFFQF